MIVVSLCDIAKKLNSHHSSIDVLLENHQKTRNYYEKEGRGRRRNTTASKDKEIIRATKRQRDATSQKLKD